MLPTLGAFALALSSLAPAALGANQNVQRTDVTLTPSLFAPTNAIADATFTIHRHRSDFEVNVEDLGPGVYDVYVGGQPRTQMLVSSTTGGAQGKVELSTRPLAGQLALLFVPTGQSIEIRLGPTILFSGKLDSSANPGGPDPYPTFNNVSEKIDLAVHDASGAKGKINLKSAGRVARLDFSFNKLLPGQYIITANDIEIGDFTTNKKGKAKVRFRSNPKNNDILLDFDPASTTFQIMRGATVIMSGTTDSRSIGGGALPIGTTDQTFNNTGAYPGASGDAVFRDKGDTFEFDVNVKGLPVAAYDLLVDGMNVATIVVTADGDSTKGALKFSTNAGGSSVLPLDFDPRGQNVQILQGETILLSMTFPD